MVFTKSILTLLSITHVASAFVPLSPLKANSHAIVVKTATTDEMYIDEERRSIMNVLMVGAGLTVVGEFGIPFALFFFPPGVAGAGGSTSATDALGNEIIAADYLASKPVGDRSLVQGLKGDAT